MTEDEIRDLFREMRDEPIPADSLARVRIGVNERTQSRRWFGFWRIAAVLLASACVLWVALSRRTAAPVPAPPPAPPIVAMRQAAPAPALASARPIVHRRRPKPARHIERTQIAGGATLIRIETPDPDVVILLLGD